MGKKKTTEEFIAQAKAVHGDKYDYSLAEYKNSHIKIKIICKIHGAFWTIPSHHLRKIGCPKCYGHKTTEDFIKLSKEIHGNKYDYSKSIYVSAKKMVLIICPTHGEFFQTASGHLDGYGCKKCVGLNRKTTDEFIVKAQKRHQNRYDYSKSIYISTHKPLIIICPIHGEIKQTPANHYRYGCFKCFKTHKYTSEEFIELAIKKHNSKYDYSKVVYEKTNMPIKIICKIHGEFIQLPMTHLRGSNCPHCVRESSSSKNEMYLRELITTHFHKLKLEINFREYYGLRKLELDIWLPEINLAIEWNGIYWHNFLNNIKKDRFKKKVLGENLIQITDPAGEDKKFVNKMFLEVIKPEIEKRLS
jgi:hypothetical protein